MLEPVSKASAISLSTEETAGQEMLLWVSPKYYTILKLQPSYIVHLIPFFLSFDPFHLSLVPEEEEKHLFLKKNLSVH